VLPNPVSKKGRLLLVHDPISENSGADARQLVLRFGLIVIPRRTKHADRLSISIFRRGEFVSVHGIYNRLPCDAVVLVFCFLSIARKSASLKTTTPSSLALSNLEPALSPASR